VERPAGRGTAPDRCRSSQFGREQAGTEGAGTAAVHRPERCPATTRCGDRADRGGRVEANRADAAAGTPGAGTAEGTPGADTAEGTPADLAVGLVRGATGTAPVRRRRGPRSAVVALVPDAATRVRTTARRAGRVPTSAMEAPRGSRAAPIRRSALPSLARSRRAGPPSHDTVGPRFCGVIVPACSFTKAATRPRKSEVVRPAAPLYARCTPGHRVSRPAHRLCR